MEALPGSIVIRRNDPRWDHPVRRKIYVTSPLLPRHIEDPGVKGESMSESGYATPRNKVACAAVFVIILAAACAAFAGTRSVLGRLDNVEVVTSTVPSNGDVNPYGVFRVPASVGNLVKGHILVSNFNNSANLQGTGTTIVDISPSGSMQLFAQIDASHLPGSCPGGVGLTTALVVLRAGWVVVGSLPTADGTA